MGVGLNGVQDVLVIIVEKKLGLIITRILVNESLLSFSSFFSRYRVQNKWSINSIIEF